MADKNLIEIIKRVEKLESALFGTKKNKTPLKISGHNIDFSVNERAFVTEYAVGKSGPRKFTFLLAYLVKGDVSKNCELSEIENCWNRMSAKKMLGGKFNHYYSNQAKNEGWVDVKERGKYN